MLDGRAGAGAEPPPRKSRPNNESPALVCFGGAASAFGGALVPDGGPELARGGVGSSPKRSITGWGFGRGGGLWAEPAARRCEADLSICTFSCTFFRGCATVSPTSWIIALALTISSSSGSRDEGSGIPPSMTHRFDSYFVRIKFSIFASEGTCPGASFASQYLFALALPHLSTLCSCSSVQVSRSTDLTLLICVPMPRCMPEHRMQTKTPRFQLAHRGSVVGVSRHTTQQRCRRAYVCSSCSLHRSCSLRASPGS